MNIGEVQEALDNVDDAFRQLTNERNLLRETLATFLGKLQKKGDGCTISPKLVDEARLLLESAPPSVGEICNLLNDEQPLLADRDEVSLEESFEDRALQFVRTEDEGDRTIKNLETLLREVYSEGCANQRAATARLEQSDDEITQLRQIAIQAEKYAQSSHLAIGRRRATPDALLNASLLALISTWRRRVP